jgi:2-methylcitrate dehydratase PrpD
MRQIAYKRYPVGGPDQTPLYAFLQLIQKNELTADDIEQMEVSVSRGAFHTVMTNKHPSVHMETILSLAAVYGEINFKHIHDPSYREDPRFKAFRDRVRIFIIPRPEPATSGQRLEMGITVHTRSGEVLHQELRFPLMTEEEMQHKFRDLVSLRVDSSRVTDLERKLKSIETVDNVAPLIRELELDY